MAAAKDAPEPAVAAEPVKVVAQEKEAALTLDEFCLRLSTTDTRTELIAGYHSVEKKNDRQKDTETAFRARFEAFVNEPA